ncbi:AraC family transcriptional regulator [Solitalea longa]|uniref:AraC family transcriptional regulator n=1 Tax=Solitalea longa TaxID=2079460 RepID=A0A2S5A7N3_9SPHI|nr:AraC family transcriptional regulator [Solitalea longa]POY38611.1 AraC family transcriptional regulator [Solitalea longa]
MEGNKKNNGFVGEKLISVPDRALNKYVLNSSFINALYLTQIGYYPNADLHYRKREKGSTDYVLIYCLEGKGHVETPRGVYSLQYNQFILLPPDQYHSYWADSESPWTIYWVHVNGNMLNELNHNLKLAVYEAPTNLPFNDQIMELWDEMYSSLSDGFTEENLGYTNLCLSRFMSFFLYPSKGTKVQSELMKEDQLDQSKLYMKANIHKRLTVDEIAKKFNYSPSHYSTLFKQKEGVAPIDYFIRIKIRCACQLLAQSNLIIKEVAEKIGYDDPYYFSRIFKKVTGKSPHEYRLTTSKNRYSTVIEELALAI